MLSSEDIEQKQTEIKRNIRKFVKVCQFSRVIRRNVDYWEQIKKLQKIDIKLIRNEEKGRRLKSNEKNCHSRYFLMEIYLDRYFDVRTK